jgi:hypothetical protein
MGDDLVYVGTRMQVHVRKCDSIARLIAPKLYEYLPPIDLI